MEEEIRHLADEMAPSAAGMMTSLALDYPPIETTLRAVAWTCWKCGVVSPAFGLVHVEDFTGPWDVISTVQGIELDRDLLLATGSPLASTIKVRRSRTRGTSLLSSGCMRCDALFGPYFIDEEIMGILASDSVATMPIVVQLKRPQLEFFILDAMRKAR
jgi:hypothetical protein